MIIFNPQKIFDFLFVVTSSFFLAMAGNYFFEWDFQFGLTVGLLLGSWSTLYDLGSQIIIALNGEDDEEAEEEGKQ